MRKGYRLRFCSRCLSRVSAFVLLGALIITSAPIASWAVGDGFVADSLTEHLYIPDGVNRGIAVSENGAPEGLSPVYGRLAEDSGASALDELPSEFDLRDLDAVTPVRNQYRWSDCWVFGAVGSLESNLIMQGRATKDNVDFSELQLTDVRRSKASADDLAKIGASSQEGEGIEPRNISFSSSVNRNNAFLLSLGHQNEVSDAIFSGMGPILEEEAPFTGSSHENTEWWYSYNDIEGFKSDFSFPSGSSDWSLENPYGYTSELWLDSSQSLGSLAITQEDDSGKITYEGPDWEASNRVKKALMDNGAVSLQIHTRGSYSSIDEDYYNADEGAQYVSEPLVYNHIVTLIGWDDNFPKENFSTVYTEMAGINPLPPDDGAWIIKDSYGSSLDADYHSNAGYQGSGIRYISYYDQGLAGAVQLVAGQDAASNDVIQQYDLLGTSPFSDALLLDEQAAVSNVFTAEQDMTMDATTVSTVINGSSVNIKVYLLDADSGNPADGELLLEQDATFGNAGRYRVSLEKPLELEKGQRFSIVEEIRADIPDPESGAELTVWYLPFECGTTESYADERGFTFCWDARINAGESYVMAGGAWGDATLLNESQDLTEGHREYGNALIKVYGSSEEEAPSYTPMYRLYNRYTGEHFYTASAYERDSLSSVGWDYEGVGWTAPASGDPVYRLYNPYAPGGDHHYTTSAHERDALVAEGWSYEGVGWSSAAGGADRVPLYRQYNPYASTGTHNYTASLYESDHLVSLGWRAEGIAWYGVG